MLGHCIQIKSLFVIINLLILIIAGENEGSVNEIIENDQPVIVNNRCNIPFNVEQFLADINALDEEYADARNEFHDLVGGRKFDNRMLQTMLNQQGAATRTIFRHADDGQIPAGINLGGRVIMRLDRTVLFFYRMKLRNSTVFQLNRVSSDFRNMTLSASLGLQDLRLYGTFSNCIRRRKTTQDHDYYLNCQHKFGHVQFLLKDVTYNVQGRYRLLQDRLIVEDVVSTLGVNGVSVSWSSLDERKWSQRDSSALNDDQVWRNSLDEYVMKLKTGLDLWIKDYFNDYLMYQDALDESEVKNFLKYDLEKTKLANDFVDNFTEIFTGRLRAKHQACPSLPDYTLTPTSKMTMLELVRGKLIGLDSMYRRSVATVSAGEDIREVNAVVGFSNIKVHYTYELVRNTHPYTGLMVMTADDVTAHLSIKINKSRHSEQKVVVKMKFLESAKSEFLSIRGVGLLPAFKSLIYNQVTTIMMETIFRTIQNLGVIADCESKIPINSFVFDVSENNTMSDDDLEDENDKPDKKALRLNRQNNEHSKSNENINNDNNKGSNNNGNVKDTGKSYIDLGFRLYL